MAQKDLHNNIKIVRAISPTRVADNTAQVGQIIDTAGFEGVEFVIETGTLADVDATFATTLDEGSVANLSDASAVAAADLLGTYAAASFASSDDDKTFKLGYRGAKRYLRLTITPTNNTGNADIAAQALLGFPRHAPVS